MSSSRFSVLGFGVVLLDYVLVLVLAAIATLAWVSVWSVHAPNPAATLVVLIAVAVLLALGLVWIVSSRRVWRVTGTTCVLAAGVLGLLHSLDVTNRLEGLDSQAVDAVWKAIHAAVFLLAAIGLWLVRRRLLKRGAFTGAVRGALVAGIAGFLTYLAWDESPAPSIARNHAALAGRFDDEETYRLTLRYSTSRDSEKVFAPLRHELKWGQNGEKRRAFLLAHRAEIEANWAELAEVRVWCVEMASRPKLGDRAIKSFEQPIMKFQPVRHYMLHGLAVAELRALDGDPDGALASVLEIYNLGVRMEPETGTLVRAMIAQVVKKSALTSAGNVLDYASVSSDSRERFAAVLEASAGGGGVIKRVILVESEFWSADSIRQIGGSVDGAGAVRPWYMRCVSDFIVNPQASANRVHDHFEALAAKAEARDIEGMSALDDSVYRGAQGKVRVKNVGGARLLEMIVGSYRSVAKNYWEIEDRRAALVERLRAVATAP
ncbi:MAG: hypothetical protein K0R17_123 [Rariglobus sp.]|jgi:hypothetical protein|nr:hypothetical protein [Rariglobus sp.]